MRLALWQGSSPAADIDAACIQAEAALAAAALVAKDAEIARLRGFINDLIDAAENDRRRAQPKGETP